MKKLLFTLALVCGLFLFGVICSGAEDYTLPQCAVYPTIDGVVSENEWYGAYHQTFTPTNGKWDKVVWNTGVDHTEACPSYDIYMFWYNDPNESGDILDIQHGGLYICVVAPDTSRSGDPGTGAYNAADVLQFFCDPLYSRRSDIERTFCYDFAPYNAAGKADFYEHYQFGSKPLGLSIDVKSKVTSAGYTMEIFLPWAALNVNNRIPAHKIGTKMGMGFVSMDYIGASFYYYAYDFGDGKAIENCAANAKTLNTVTFGETVYPPGYVATGDTTALAALIATTDALIADKAAYTAASYMVFEQALTKAKAITIDNKQAEIDAAYKQLNTAIVGLAKTADMTIFEQLQSTITLIESLNEADYEAESWAALQAALTAAKAVSETDDEAAVTAANTSLTIAVDSLLLVGETKEDSDISVLKTLINQIDTLTEANYTPESWAAMKSLYDAALLLTTSSSQYEIDDALAKLQAAKDALVSLDSDAAGGDNAVQGDNGLSTGALIGIIAGSVVIVAAVVVVVIIVLKKKKTGAAPEDTAKATDNEDKPE